MAVIYTLFPLESGCRPRWWCLICVIVCLTIDIVQYLWFNGDIPAFVMYCDYGESGSSLIIVYRLYDYYSYSSVDLA